MDASSTPGNRLNSLERAIATLRRFTSAPIQDDRDCAGIVQAFEFTFELAWKCIQEWVIAAGFEERGPRASLRAAFRGELILEEGEKMLQSMADDRNLASHIYREEEIRAIADRIVGDYVAALESVAQKLRAATG